MSPPVVASTPPRTKGTSRATNIRLKIRKKILKRPRAAPEYQGGCPYETATGVCGKRRRLVASDHEKYCWSHAHLVDGMPQKYHNGCPYETPKGSCGKQRKLVASDTEKYCNKHAAIINGCSVRASPSSEPRYCPTCAAEGELQTSRRETWCQGYC